MWPHLQSSPLASVLCSPRPSTRGGRSRCSRCCRPVVVLVRHAATSPVPWALIEPFRRQEFVIGSESNRTTQDAAPGHGRQVDGKGVSKAAVPLIFCINDINQCRATAHSQ